jgi:haloacetate dehalogenase
MGKLFNMQDAWSKIYPNLVTESISGGHFFVDQYPNETANRLLQFLNTGK